MKPHSDRVMGIAIDSKKGNAYSCSTDKKFIISDINYQESFTEIAVSSHGFTNLIFDKRNERVFLTNEVGVFSAYSTNTTCPILLTTIQTKTKNSIKGIHINYTKSLIFTGSMDGIISVLDLCTPGKERFIKEISSFESKMKIREIVHNSKNNELILGDENGKITIWSLKLGKPICKI